MQRIPIPNELAMLARIFAGAGFPLYAVGGMVRNPLLGLPVHDMDVTAAMRMEDVRALCAAHGVRCREKGAFFGTLDLAVGDCRFEYAAFRAERYGAGGAHRPADVRFTERLEEDALRRDFTVNALYYDVLRDEIIDPTGGLADLARRVVRATSPDPNVILAGRRPAHPAHGALRRGAWFFRGGKHPCRCARERRRDSRHFRRTCAGGA